MQTPMEPGVFSTNRESYLPDGYFDRGRMMLAAVACLGVAALVAAGLSFLFYSGFYFVLFIPLLAALACGAAVSQAVTVSQCRHPLVAGLLGSVVSLTAYIGGYHACMLWEIGIANAHRVDALPAYLTLRWETDTVEDARDLHGINEANRAQASPARYWGNLGLFLLEASIMAGIGFILPRMAAKRPYCSKHGCWLVETKGSVRHDGSSVSARPSVRNQLANRGADEFTLQHCPNALAGRDQCDIYLSGTKLIPSRYQTRKENLIDNVQLSFPEIAEFASLLPVDRLPSAPWPANVFAQKNTTNSYEFVEPPLFADELNATHVATVAKVESPHGGRFNTRFHRNLRNATVYAPFLGLFGGLGAMCGPLALKNIGWDLNLSAWWTLAGFSLLPITAFLCVAISTVPYNSMRKLAETFFPQRANAIVDFSNSKSRFAVIMPRNDVSSHSFGEWDFGIVEADPVRNEIRFEGDIERYHIPVASIMEFEIEPIVFCSTQNSTSYEYLVRVVFQTERGPMERLFSQRHLWRAMSNDDARRQPARDLFMYLQSALVSSPAQTVADPQLAVV